MLRILITNYNIFGLVGEQLRIKSLKTTRDKDMTKREYHLQQAKPFCPDCGTRMDYRQVPCPYCEGSGTKILGKERTKTHKTVCESCGDEDYKYTPDKFCTKCGGKIKAIKILYDCPGCSMSNRDCWPAEQFQHFQYKCPKCNYYADSMGLGICWSNAYDIYGETGKKNEPLLNERREKIRSWKDK